MQGATPFFDAFNGSNIESAKQLKFSNVYIFLGHFTREGPKQCFCTNMRHESTQNIVRNTRQTSGLTRANKDRNNCFQ